MNWSSHDIRRASSSLPTSSTPSFSLPLPLLPLSFSSLTFLIVFNQIWKPKLNTNWSSHDTRRAFFDNFAQSQNFDPLVVENWYMFSSQDITKKVIYKLPISIITWKVINNFLNMQIYASKKKKSKFCASTQNISFTKFRACIRNKNEVLNSSYLIAKN